MSNYENRLAVIAKPPSFYALTEFLFINALSELASEFGITLS